MVDCVTVQVTDDGGGNGENGENGNGGSGGLALVALAGWFVWDRLNGGS